MSSGTTEYILGVWGSSANDVFAVAENGDILHYNGSVWSQAISGLANYLWGIWGSDSNDVFAVGPWGIILHYDGVSWTKMRSQCNNHIENIWGSSGINIFAVGDDGTILHYSNSIPSCTECAGDPVYLSNVTFEAGTNCECTATTPITIGTNVRIKNGATVTFKAPSGNVEPGFHAESGSVVKMRQ